MIISFFFYISNIFFGNFILRVAGLMELLSLILKYELRIFVRSRSNENKF